MAVKASRQWAEEELDYILSVDPLRPGKSFSYNAECFARYCAMQARHVAESGHPDLAYAMHSYANPRAQDF